MAIFRMGIIPVIAFAVTLSSGCLCSFAQSDREIAGLAKTRKFVVPMLYDPLALPYPVVMMRLNGGKPLPFMVDTGEPDALLIQPWVIQTLKLPVQQRFTARGTEYTKVTITRAELQTTRSDAPLSLPIPHAWSYRLNATEDVGRKPIAGLIGMDVLLKYTLQFDFAAKKLTFYEGTHPPLQVPDSKTISLDHPDYVPGDPPEEKDPRFIIRLQYGLPGKPRVQLFVDTASPSSNLPSSIMSRLSPEAKAEAEYAFVARVHSAQATAHTRNIYHFPLFYLGFVEPNVFLGSNPIQGFPSVIGLDILARYRVVFDFQNKQLHLRQASDHARYTRPLGVNPFILAGSPGEYYVDEFYPEGSVAARAGVRKGDRIVKVDGQNAGDWLGQSVLRLIQGYANTRAELVLERKGANGQKRRLTVGYIRPSMFTPKKTKKSGAGLRFGVDDKGYFIAEVITASAAKEAGLWVGDRIIEINRKTTASSTPEQIRAGLDKTEGAQVQIKVQRPGEDRVREVTWISRKLPINP
jgi:membrane-associated protease RseP (regulator of RpoE activity)